MSGGRNRSHSQNQLFSRVSHGGGEARGSTGVCVWERPDPHVEAKQRKGLPVTAPFRGLGTFRRKMRESGPVQGAPGSTPAIPVASSSPSAQMLKNSLHPKGTTRDGTGWGGGARRASPCRNTASSGRGGGSTGRGYRVPSSRPPSPSASRRAVAPPCPGRTGVAVSRRHPCPLLGGNRERRPGGKAGGGWIMAAAKCV